ncbi:TPA: hypothetical protein TXT63_001626 [Streptococcus suis]|uniref:Phage protein n=1 Tax=Streptococcus suis TaxID=1307 RepID=A0A3R8MZP8_STRSU|nr:hypothetical protein [Streptococcus suis]MDN2948192.1 hypothetical protein [Streptococcus suis]RRN48784.1 hypothetical protein EI220_10755 [Streptococcus suis]HEL1563728.1 hypothetical protein [Streptococcus suis]HEL1761946.1 hypothetical protein [Streptococcus suis]HEL1909321.1 hypothetical protein [Streptococcus suis]
MKVLLYIVNALRRLNDRFEAKIEARNQYFKEVMKEFGELYDRGRAGELKLPENTLTKFAKTRNIKQVEKLNHQIKEMNGL